MNSDLGAKLTGINRQYLYVFLFVLVIFGLIFPINLPVNPSPQTQALYDAVEAAPAEKIAFVSTLWTASTQGENRPQTRVLLQHVMRRHMPFVVASFGLDAQANQLVQELAEEVTAEWNKEHPDFTYEYGKNWVNLGFRVDMPGTLKGIVVDLKGTYKTDSKYRKDLNTYPVLDKVKNTKDLSIILEVAPSNGYKNWLGLVAGSTEAKLGYSVTSVMGPELYTYIDSKQMVGMMFGIRGAAEYEKLMGIKGFTFRAMTPISYALIYLFALIAIGNYGMFLTQRAAKREA